MRAGVLLGRNMYFSSLCWCESAMPLSVKRAGIDADGFQAVFFFVLHACSETWKLIVISIVPGLWDAAYMKNEMYNTPNFKPFSCYPMGT